MEIKGLGSQSPQWGESPKHPLYEKLHGDVQALLASSPEEFLDKFHSVRRELAQAERNEKDPSKKATLGDIGSHLEELSYDYGELSELNIQKLNPTLADDEQVELDSEIHMMNLDIRHEKARIDFSFNSLLGLEPLEP